MATPSTVTERAERSSVPGPRLSAALIFALALAVRFWVLATSKGGIRGIPGYDAGVYFSASDALIHGRMPYGEFVLVHPPGIMLALTPFALLAQVTSDHSAFIVANLAFEVLGALSAVLVLATARKLGCGAGAALLGGAMYAVWFGAIDAEFQIRLECLGSVVMLVGLFLLAGTADRPRPSGIDWRLIGAGAAFGAAASVKIWWIVPVLLVVGWHVGHAALRGRAGPLAIGAAAGLLLVNGPFFVAHPATMWRMVVLDQLGRHESTLPLKRLGLITTVRYAFPRLHGPANWALLGIISALVVLIGVLAWRGQRPGGLGRLTVLIAACQALVLAVAPSYYGFYAGFLAAGLALEVALAASTVRARPARLAVGALLPIAAVLTVFTLGRPNGSVAKFPGAALAARTPAVRCIVADSNQALIQLNVLSRSLANGCPNWVDVSGRTYGVDAAHPYVKRPRNLKWQRDLLRYLKSGDAFIVIRPETGLSQASWVEIKKHRVIARSGKWVVRSSR